MSEPIKPVVVGGVPVHDSGCEAGPLTHGYCACADRAYYLRSSTPHYSKCATQQTDATISTACDCAGRFEGAWDVEPPPVGKLYISDPAGLAPFPVLPGGDIDELERALAHAAALADLLRRISEWDHMDVAADGPYWRREIASLLRAYRESGREKP